MIDHIIAKSKVSKVTFIGISQGCTSYMVLSSLRPEYNEKILLANLVAPVTTFYPTKSIVLKTLTLFNFIVEVRQLNHLYQATKKVCAVLRSRCSSAKNMD